MPVNPSREYLVKDLVKKITDAGHLPVEHRDQFEKELLRDVDHAIHRYRSGLANTLAAVMFSPSGLVRPAA